MPDSPSLQDDKKASLGWRNLVHEIIKPFLARTQTEINYLSAYSCYPPPLFTIIITFIQVSVFFYYFYKETPEGSLGSTCAGCFSPSGNESGPLLFDPRRRREVWRFLSYSFLHLGVEHLLWNMVTQLILGIPLELVHKAWRIGPLYLLAVLAGSLLHYALSPANNLVGASAGGYAFITAHLANLVLNWNEMPLRYLRLVFISSFLASAGFSLYYGIVFTPCEKISHAGHIGGALVGFCFGVIILYNVTDRPWKLLLQKLCMGVLGLYFGAAISFAVLREPNADPLLKEPSRCSHYPSIEKQ